MAGLAAKTTGTGFGDTARQDLRVRVVVVAEDFRCCAKLGRKAEFLSDQGDHIDRYGPDVIDGIITESDIRQSMLFPLIP
jgi:hypothetical protein